MTRRFFATVALLLAASSCTTADTASSDPGGDPEMISRDFIADELDAEPSQNSAVDPDIASGELEEIRSLLFGTNGADSDLTLHLRHEEILVSCMAGQGFEYVALQYSGYLSSPLFDASVDADEFARRYGLGISTLYEANELASAVVAATWVDPNDDRISAMSQAERAAYYSALYGPPAEGHGSEDGSYTPDDPTAGCSGEAAEVYGGVHALDLSDDARNALLNIEQVVRADPAVRTAEAEWSSCMGADGYDVATPDDLIVIAELWLSPILATSSTKKLTTTDDTGSSITVEVPDLDGGALATVQQREIELALTNRDCDDASGLSDATTTARSGAQAQTISQWYGELAGSN